MERDSEVIASAPIEDCRSLFEFIDEHVVSSCGLDGPCITVVNDEGLIFSKARIERVTTPQGVHVYFLVLSD